MTLFQFLTISAFVLICIFITFYVQRKHILLLQERDSLLVMLADLLKLAQDAHKHDKQATDADRNALIEALGSAVQEHIRAGRLVWKDHDLIDVKSGRVVYSRKVP